MKNNQTMTLKAEKIREEVGRINEYKNKIKEEVGRINEYKNKIKELENIQNRKLRVKSRENGKSNELIRVSNNFFKKLEFINKEREENGFDCLSNPKITELIISHKKFWRDIEEDIIHFNTGLEEGEGFHNEK